MESAACCICGGTDGEPIGVGEDFEYRSSNDSFLAVRCPHCTLVYLDPRPTPAELSRIYPDDYHAFEFSAEQYGLVHAVRSRLEARRILKVLGELPSGARVLDVGCGDGFHLDLLRTHGPKDWVLEGVDLDKRAVAAGLARDLVIHHGTVEGLDLPAVVLRRRPHDPDDRARRPPAGRAGGHQATAQAGRPAHDRHRQHRLARLPPVVPALLGRLPLPAPLEPLQRALDPSAGGQDRLRGGLVRDDRVAGQLDLLGAQRPRRRGRAALARQPVQPHHAGDPRRCSPRSTPCTRRCGGVPCCASC